MAASSSSGGTVGMTPHGSRGDSNPQQIQKLLDENAQIIKALVEAQNLKGKTMDIMQYQQILHRNLVYLAGLADPRVDIHQILPPPGSSNLLQSQRAPPPNQTISSNMTPPPSSTSQAPPTTGMSRPPNASVTSMPSSHWMGGVTTPSMMGAGQYNMKGYAPAPWLSGQGGGYGPPLNSTQQQQQQRMVNERRQQQQQQQQQMLRMHQEKLIRTQQARQLQQQQQSGGPMPGGVTGNMGLPQPRGYPPMGYMSGPSPGTPPMSYGGAPPTQGGGSVPQNGAPSSTQQQMDM